MVVLSWVLIAWFTLIAVATPAQIGKPREPLAAGGAWASVAICIGFIVALAVLGVNGS